METLIVLLLLVVIALLLRNANQGELRHMELSDRLRRLTNRVNDFTEAAVRRESEPAPVARDERPPQPRPAPRPPAPEPPAPVYREPAPEAAPEPRPQTTPVPQAAAAAAPPFTPRETALERFFREHPDLEKFIGENLVNKIGIAILVLGIGFFVKYAIDQDWIGEAGRVAIGIGCGALLIGLAHYLRRSYKAFSAVLAGGGIAVLYTSISFAFHQYGLLAQPVAFVLMVVITAFAVLLALLYDSLALAVIATLGGFAAPFLVSNGSGNYVVLFTYLAVLNAGILAVAFYRRWPLLQSLAFGCTVLITGGWLLQVHGMILTGRVPEGTPEVRYGLALALLTLNYALFLGSTLAYPLRHKLPFRARDLAFLLLLTAAYYCAGMLLLDRWEGGRYQGLFTIASGAVDLALATWCFRRKGTDRNLLYVLIGLALSFATLAVPVQLQGHAITLFWSAEFVLLYWLFQRSGIPLFRWSSWLLMALALCSLFMDWMQSPATAGGLTVLFASLRGGITNAVATAAFAAYYFLLRRGESAAHPGPGPERRVLQWITGSIALLLLYGSLLSAVNLYFYNMRYVDVPNIYHRIITAAMALIVGETLRRRRQPAAAALGLGLTAIALVYYLASQDALQAFRYGLVARNYHPAHLAGQAVATLLYLVLLLRTALSAARDAALEKVRRPLAWGLSAVIVLFLSLDAGQYYSLGGNAGAIARREAQYVRAALTVLWGLCSFVLMWLGMRHKAQVLRVISLSLFGIALLKLFFFDLRNLSEGGRIVAFILLGALLLTISFMYQKLKKILLDDRTV